MALWLFKVEPGCYSYDDLERDGSTSWDGVTNALAQKHLRAVKAGDEILFYHTGDEKAIVVVMRASADPVPAPDDASGKRVMIPVEPIRKLDQPVTLSAIKAEESFQDWELVRMSRLSVMPVSARQWKKIEAMSKKGKK